MFNAAEVVVLCGGADVCCFCLLSSVLCVMLTCCCLFVFSSFFFFPFLRREFPNLEFFYCLGCSDQQAEFVDVDRKIVHVCPTFAKKLWNDIDYDRCGLALGGSSDWPFILPRIEYSDATTFLNIDGIKPPYFSGYTVVVDEKDGSNCFASSMAAIRATLSTAVVLLLSVVVSAML